MGFTIGIAVVVNLLCGVWLVEHRGDMWVMMEGILVKKRADPGSNLNVLCTIILGPILALLVYVVTRFWDAWWYTDSLCRRNSTKMCWMALLVFLILPFLPALIEDIGLVVWAIEIALLIVGAFYTLLVAVRYRLFFSSFKI
jgi:hypothetical protein